MYNIAAAPDWVCMGSPDDLPFVKAIIERLRPEAFVCANDHMAANLMHRLDELGMRIPNDVRIVGAQKIYEARCAECYADLQAAYRIEIDQDAKLVMQHLIKLLKL